MKKNILYICLLVCTINVQAQIYPLPSFVFSGVQGKFHVQGVAVDRQHGFVYFSFTDRLIKTDLKGNLIGSVTGFVGHLGDIDIADDGRIYASLEYKNDAIGKGIQKSLNVSSGSEDVFYIAIFDAARITRTDIQAEKEDILRTVYIKEAVMDYQAKVFDNGIEKLHRYGCSGVDGIAVAPSIGGKDKTRDYVYLSYGIYGDTTRNDNDHQVVLKYKLTDLDHYAQSLTQNQLHHSGPSMPADKYFVKTGNTRYGIQNLAYDAFTGNFFAAVYRGEKKGFPNCDLFVIDGKQKPSNQLISSGGKQVKVKTFALIKPLSENPKINGWFFEWGSTGLCPLGDGEFYISHNEKAGQFQQSTLFKYRWVGEENKAFERSK